MLDVTTSNLDPQGYSKRNGCGQGLGHHFFVAVQVLGTQATATANTPVVSPGTSLPPVTLVLSFHIPSPALRPIHMRPMPPLSYTPYCDAKVLARKDYSTKLAGQEAILGHLSRLVAMASD